MWIFKSGLQDFLRIYLPGIIGLILVSFFSYNNLNLILYLLIFHVIDVGHLYATLLRTIFNKQELKSNYKTLATPLLVTVVTLVWLYFKIPYFWTFYILFTVFHNLRQGWGIVRWYEKKNKIFHNNAYFYYTLTIVPFILFHLKETKNNLIYYTQNDYENFSFLRQSININIGNWTFNDQNILLTLFASMYVISLSYWVLKEILYAIKNKVEYNRLTAMIYFGSVYAYAFFFAESEFQISTMLILSHALPYIFIMNKFLKIKDRTSTIASLTIIVIVGGLINFLIEDIYEIESIFNYTQADIGLTEYLLTLIYIVPIICHYVYDMYLWKKEHPENAQLYND